MFGRRVLFRNIAKVSKQEKGQSFASEQKSSTQGNTFTASGLADNQDPLALRKAAWKYGILSVLFGIVAGVIQYKRSSRETKETSTTKASTAGDLSSPASMEQVPDALVELQLTQIELESQLKRLVASGKTADEESLQEEVEQVQQKLAQVERELKAYQEATR